MKTTLLGLPLDAALEELRRRGMGAPLIERTRSPRGEKDTGTERVVRVSEDMTRLVVARFRDHVTEEA